MRKTFLILAPALAAVVAWAVVAEAAQPKTAPNPFESPMRPSMSSRIDRLVFEKLKPLDVKPILCSDAVFVRRAYLDVTGTLPTAEEAWKFIKDPNRKNKRRILIDRLLERDEFADYWSMKWGDVLRIKAEFPINLWPNAAQAYHRWVRASIAENKPYDKFAREMLTSSGSNFRVGPVNFYRAVQNKTPEGIATAVALTFMGTRTDSWTKEQLEGTAKFFSQIGYKPTSEWKEQHVYWDPLGSKSLPGSTAPGNAAVTTAMPPTGDISKLPATSTEPMTAVFPDGTKVEIPPNQDPREVFADWLITPENRWFTRAIANRVWAWIMGRGIIHEPDDIRVANPPSNPELLAYLEKELIDSGYDLKHLYRLILNSSTYQLTSIPRQDNHETRANFACYPMRRLEAEVLIDAVNKITGTTDLYTSAIPEPFTYIPKDMPAIAMADGSITSPFLAMFGRSARATGMTNERDNKPVPAQWLHMLNSSHIQRKLEQGPALKEIFSSNEPHVQIVRRLYLTILSRPPTQEEMEVIAEFVKATRSKRQAAIDVSWALINSPEFLYRH